MRFTTYFHPSSETPRAAIVLNVASNGDMSLVDLEKSDPKLPSDMMEILPRLRDKSQQKRFARAIKSGEPRTISRGEVFLPVPKPEKILCVGLNYRDHAAECDQKIPDQPVWFNKLPTALCGPNQPIQLPKVSRFVDYEAELVVVIGRAGRDIPESEAMDYVAGYTCGNDVTARDWQFGRPGGQWFAGKTFDTFAPLGPVLVTPDEIPDPHQLAIESRVNAEIRQQSTTSNFIFSIPFLIHEISTFCTLTPGDLIYTGTPPGIGYAREPQTPLQAGDVVEIEIAGIGILRNPVRDHSVPQHG